MSYAADIRRSVAPRSTLLPSHGGAASRLLGGAALGIGIFALDSFGFPDAPMAVLYVVVLMIVSPGISPAHLRLWTAACMAMTFLGFEITRGAATTNGWLQLVTALSAIAVTSSLLRSARATHEALRSSEERYRGIFNALASAVWEHDFSAVQRKLARCRAAGVTDIRRYVADHPQFVRDSRKLVRITDANAAALAMIGAGPSDARIAYLSDFLPEEDGGAFAECLVALDERRAVFQVETQILSGTGGLIDVIAAFGLGEDMPLDRVPGMILDISERKRLEAQVLQARSELEKAHRASALGALSASIAHEVNQPLAAIQTCARAASRWLKRNPPDIIQARQALDTLIEGVAYAHDVVRRVRALVGTSLTDPQPIDLAALIRTAGGMMLPNLAERTIALRYDITIAEALVPGDATLLTQVFVNLITNAMHAVAAMASDRRIISVSAYPIDDDVVIEVSDTGIGWPEEDHEDLFDPFFTTKQDGMGLGLSICRSIVEAHGGTICLRDAVGGGATVSLTLPTAKQ